MGTASSADAPLCLVITGGLGAGLGTEVFALSTLLARSGEAAGWQMPGQVVEDHRGFLRLHIAPDGDLTIYPLVIDEICHEWQLVDDPAVRQTADAGLAAALAPTAREPPGGNPRAEPEGCAHHDHQYRTTTRSDHVTPGPVALLHQAIGPPELAQLLAQKLRSRPSDARFVAILRGP